MTNATLTAAEANTALKPFGIRVETWGNSKTKLCIFHKDGSAETMIKAKVAELIKLRQQYG